MPFSTTATRVSRGVTLIRISSLTDAFPLHVRVLYCNHHLTASSKRAVSNNGSPMTLEWLPDKCAMNAAARPWIAYPPALPKHSPVPTYSAICAEPRLAKRTVDSPTARDSRPAPSHHTPAIPRCVRPDSQHASTSGRE